MRSREVRLIVPSRLEAVREVGEAVRALWADLRLDEVVAYQMELAVVEAVTNAIQHAYGGASGHEVKICAALRGDCLAVEISDTGIAMDPRRLEQPPAVLDFDPQRRDRLPERGFGLTIIREVMDGVEYLSAGGRNTLRLYKRLPVESEAHGGGRPAPEVP